jgi:hypothetical protein
MTALRTSAWLALAVAIFVAALQIGGGLYITNVLGRPAELIQISAIITCVLFVLGAVTALRNGDNRFLITAWAWHAGGIVPVLFHHASEPARIAHDPRTQAMMDDVLRKAQHIDFTITATNSAIMLVGLGLALYRRRSPA